jgi:hypothetical protein
LGLTRRTERSEGTSGRLLSGQGETSKQKETEKICGEVGDVLEMFYNVERPRMVDTVTTGVGEQRIKCRQKPQN